jgi:predicted small lipoprotein YifL
MLKKILLAFLLIGLAGCGPLGLPSPSASTPQSTDQQPVNDFSGMRCNTNVPTTGC